MARILHILTGCTAVGKTELALRWAEANGAEIVSCDALLFYRGMNLGTAKPAPADRARVPHHLIDTCAVSEPMDIARYAGRAREAVEAVFARDRRVLVTGGSGFYLKTFLAPVADSVTVPEAVRGELHRRWTEHGLPALVEELHRLNPAGLGGLDEQNPRRVLRALERCRASGRTLAELRAAFAAQPAPFADCTVRLVELVRERDDLGRRIEARVAAMLAAGLVAEVRALLEQGLAQNPSAARAIGYRETIDFLAGRLAEGNLPGAIVQNTRALVRKQRTWFRTQLPEHRQLDARTATVDGLFG